MRVLVTGAEGQLARSLLERSRNWPGTELIAVGRPRLDLELPGNAERVIADAAPDVVINAAAYTAVDEAERDSERAFRVNADAAGEVALASAKLNAPIIQISTDYVFDGSAREAYDETAVPNPINVYGRSKLAGEEKVRAANAHHVILRTAWVYSPFGRNFVKTMIAAAGSGKTLNVVNDQCGTPTSALDLADALLTMIRAAPAYGQIYHLAGTGSTSWYGFAQSIMDECRKSGLPFAEVQPISSADRPMQARRPRNSRLNSCKFAQKFGYALPPWQQSLSKIVNRLREEA